MTTTDVVRVVTEVVLFAVALVAFRQALRQRVRATWWVFAGFAVLAVVSLALTTLPDESTDAWVALAQRLSLAALPLFPYLLFRFSADLRRPPRWLDAVGTVLTALVVLAALFGTVPGIGADDSSSSYVVLLPAQWTFVSLAVAVRLWRARRGEPSVARRRIRTMSAAALGLTIALLAASAAPDGELTSLAVRLTALAGAALFLLALAPPRFLRLRWRRAEEARLREAVSRLMAATTAGEVTATLLPEVAAVLGARGAALLGPEGEVLAAHPAGFRGAPDERGGAGAVRTDVVTLTSGELAVYTSPFTPLFGREELELLATLGGLADLALQRCRDYGIAETLQRSLLPTELPAVEGVAIEGRYMPAGSGAVGGDWYDVIALPPSWGISAAPCAPTPSTAPGRQPSSHASTRTSSTFA